MTERVLTRKFAKFLKGASKSSKIIRLKSLSKSLLICQFKDKRDTPWLAVHCKSERSVLTLKIGPIRWVKYSPIFGSNLAPLNQGQYSSIS